MEAVEYGMHVREYVLRWRSDAALHEPYFEDASLVPDVR